MSEAVRSLVNLQRMPDLRCLRAALSQRSMHSCPAALLGINKLPAGRHTITDSRAQQVRWGGRCRVLWMNGIYVVWHIMFSAEVKLCIGIRSDTVVMLYQYMAKYPIINW